MFVRGFLLTSVLVIGIGGCGSSDQGSASSAVSAASCNRQCDAQSMVNGCTPIVDTGTCKQLCGALAAQTPATCASKFDTYYDCSATAGFECTGALVSQKGGACSAEQSAFAACQNGGKKPTCAGANDAGFCPSVQCPCPSGTTPISGFSNTTGACKCFDTTTCLDLC
jgi:hypothetical protein